MYLLRPDLPTSKDLQALSGNESKDSEEARLIEFIRASNFSTAELVRDGCVGEAGGVYNPSAGGEKGTVREEMVDTVLVRVATLPCTASPTTVTGISRIIFGFGSSVH